MKTDRWPPFYEPGDLIEYWDRSTHTVRDATVTKYENGLLSLEFDHDELGGTPPTDWPLPCFFATSSIGKETDWDPGNRICLHYEGKNVVGVLVKREPYWVTFMIEGEEVRLDIVEVMAMMNVWAIKECDRLRRIQEGRPPK